MAVMLEAIVSDMEFDLEYWHFGKTVLYYRLS
jgi:hypothetical protein